MAALAGFLRGTVAAGIVPVHAQERTWPKTLTAERFVVVDAKGAKRLEIGVEVDGQGSLKVYDENGRLAWSAPDLHVWPAATRH